MSWFRVAAGRRNVSFCRECREHRQAAILSKLNVDNLPASVSPPISSIPTSKAAIEKTPATNQKQQIALARADLFRFYEKHLEAHGRWGSRKQAKNNFMRAYRSGELYPQLFAILGPVTWQTIERWGKTLRKHGDALKLAPKRGFARRGKRS